MPYSNVMSFRLLAFKGKATSEVTLSAPEEWVVARLSVFIKIRSTDARSVKVYLTSPSGTRVQLVHGATYPRVSRQGLEGWFGGPTGHPTVQSLAALEGEPASGRWVLSVRSRGTGALERWTVDARLRHSMAMISPTYGIYGSRPGCDCG